MATLTTVVSFGGTNGQSPIAGLAIDTNGDLLGSTTEGGANDDGTVFELVDGGGSYASTPTTLVNFNGTDGARPGGLIMDAAGDLFGTTAAGGPTFVAGGVQGTGTVFEVAKTSTGFASTPTTLANFNGTSGATPGPLTADATGNLFGMTPMGGGANGLGTIFEIAKTSVGYASTPTTLLNFSNLNGVNPGGAPGLIIDAAGDLIGTTESGGANSDGKVFELVKTSSGYASTLTTLINFNGANGSGPFGTLIADSAGDLFGTTLGGGAGGFGTVFEIAKTSTGFASTPTTLVSFNGTNGADPRGLIMDATGDLFGTAEAGGPTFIAGAVQGAGTVFEIAKTGSGYASTPTTLINFNGTNGYEPLAGLAADAAGDLFGTTLAGGTNNDGTAFELSNSGFRLTPTPAPVITTVPGQPTAGALIQVEGTGQSGDTVALFSDGGSTPVGNGTVSADDSFDITTTATFQAGVHSLTATEAEPNGLTSGLSNSFSVAVEPPLPTFDPSWTLVGVGDFNGGASAEIARQQQSSNTVEAQLVAGTSTLGSGPITNSPFDSSWSVVGVGDFNGDGFSDLVYRQPGSGLTEIALLQGQNIGGGGLIPNNPFGTDWNVVGVGDFNGDHEDDLVWQNSATGLVEVELLNATAGADDKVNIAGGGVIANNPFGAGWSIVTTGDFNGDGKSDLVWQNQSIGLVEIQFLNGNTAIGGGAIPNSPFDASWKVVGAGDFLGNGFDDLVYQHQSDGLVEIQYLNGNTAVGGGAIANSPFGAGWQVVGVGDFNGDGKADLVYRNSTTGTTEVQFLNGTTPIGGGIVAAG